MRRRLLLLLSMMPAFAHGLPAEAGMRNEASISVCYNYGCLSEDVVRFGATTLARLGSRLAHARSAAEERALLADAVGGLYRVAATQTAVGADRAGNFLDEGRHGRMDCIDHSTTTTRLLQLLEVRGALRFHRVVEPARRTRLILQHFSAVIEVLSAAERVARLPPGQALAGCNCTEDGQVIEDADGAERAGERYVVDSWFVDNGEPAVVLPLAEWLNGGGPNVE
ncbi:hypothetical protein [Thauera sp.]|jgi:hypothetical protein|uniref:hypothetical protein n=1 Tax=Thauera sp. TaxID=1905334 RepID=UPI00260EF242|nr:hypothetical protein [Thauera sp.]MCK6410154.1 hypothetical protein [Thauera sp.]